MSTVIDIANLTRDYGGGRGVFDLGFTVRQGEVFGFLGPNGAGKTTTIRHLMGFLRPSVGRCAIGGRDCWRQRAGVQQTLGYIPGELAMPDDMNGAAFLKFYAAYRGMKTAGRTAELLARFELDPKMRLKKMSKGMKQKVGIVAALMHDPAVLLLDEPTSGLDPLMQNRFIELVLEEKARGKTILLSSHMFEEVERTCDRVGIIRRGRLAAVDSIGALKAARRKKYVVTLDSPAAAGAFAEEGLDVCDRHEAQVTVVVRNNMGPFIAALGRHAVVNLEAPAQNLEEIFLQYYGEESA